MSKKIIALALLLIVIVSFGGCTTSEKAEDNATKNTDTKIENQEVIAQETETLISKFIPNIPMELVYAGSDWASGRDYVKGNGTKYQIIGSSGKGPYGEVLTYNKGYLTKVYKGDLTEAEESSGNEVNLLDKKSNMNENILMEPIAVGTKWDNKEIVEVGKNLKLDKITLAGDYVKTWEKIQESGNSYVKVCYYSEGLGCVKEKVVMGDSVVSERELAQVIK